MSNTSTSSNLITFTVGSGCSYESIPVALFVREVRFIALKGREIFQQNFLGTAEISAETLKFVNHRSALGWVIEDGRILIQS